MRVEFLVEAESELSEAADLYDEANPGVSVDFTREVRRAIELILDNNRIGKSVSAGRAKVCASLFWIASRILLSIALSQTASS